MQCTLITEVGWTAAVAHHVNFAPITCGVKSGRKRKPTCLLYSRYDDARRRYVEHDSRAVINRPTWLDTGDDRAS